MRFWLVPSLFALQGTLTPLLAPWSPPDLLLLAALFWLWRWPLPQGVALAYLLGLLQDLAGGGVLGLHALGLAAGVFVAGSLMGFGRARSGFFRCVAALLVALAGKWVVFALLLSYLGGGAPLEEVWRVAPLELLLSVTALALLQPLLTWLERTSRPRTRARLLPVSAPVGRPVGRPVAAPEGANATGSATARRVRVLLAVLLSGLVIIAGRLSYLQLLHGETYAQLGRANAQQPERLTPLRGRILARDGTVLAGNRVAVDLL